MVRLTVTAVIEDVPGALARICGILYRHQANIEALSVTPERRGQARIVAQLECLPRDKALITARLRNLLIVKDIDTYLGHTSTAAAPCSTEGER